MKYPKKIKDGATIGLVSPSSQISEERKMQCIETVKNMGFNVKYADNITANYRGYMAGTEEVRAEWINKMFADEEVDAIFCIRGGDGSSRIMKYIDWEIVKNNPKPFVGYSDITNLHIGINQKAGFVGFHGPMVSSNMVDNFDDETKDSFFRAINAEESYEFTNPKGFEPEVLKHGKASGELAGGNLTLMITSIGTDYEIDVRGKILFIEDVGGSLSSMDRDIFQLRNSGKFDEAAGVLLGQFNKMRMDGLEGVGVDTIFGDALDGINIPVMYNIQSGHNFPMMTLPIGAMCHIDTQNKSIVFDVER